MYKQFMLAWDCIILEHLTQYNSIIWFGLHFSLYDPFWGHFVLHCNLTLQSNTMGQWGASLTLYLINCIVLHYTLWGLFVQHNRSTTQCNEIWYSPHTTASKHYHRVDSTALNTIKSFTKVIFTYCIVLHDTVWCSEYVYFITQAHAC